MADFSPFDRRGYRTVDVRSGYAAWAASYEDTVEDAMDIELLEVLREVPWERARAAVDLGCGSGRTGAWLAGRGIAAIDGVDITAEMLARARSRRVYRRLVEADVTATGLPAAAYDLLTTSLVDEHLPTLEPLYAEAARLAAPGASYVLVGLHPHFLMSSGMPTHFEDAAGEPVAIDTHLHLLSDHVTAALGAGWRLAELRERLIDDAWARAKPRWAELRGQPLAFAFVWRADGN